MAAKRKVKTVDFKAEAWHKIEGALKALCAESYPHAKRRDKHEFYNILTIESVEPVESSCVPEREVTESNHLSESHTFDHHPTRTVEHTEHLGVHVGANGGLAKIVKIISPAVAKAGIDIDRDQKEEQKFEREPVPSGAAVERHEGLRYHCYRVKVSAQANFPIRVSRRIGSRHRARILAQKVLSQLPEFSLDEVKNTASCVVLVNSTSSYEVADISPESRQ